MKNSDPIDASKYSREYYLKNCGGFEEFLDSDGGRLPKRIMDSIKKIKTKKGEKILDIGCGRGESAFYFAKKGCQVVGIDYSKDAIKIAKEALKNQPKQVKNNVIFKVMNAKELDFSDENFNKVLMLEVWEHVYDYEQLEILSEIYRVLIEGGKAYIHTEPSKIINDWIYPYWIYPISSVLVNLSNFFSSKNYSKLSHPSLIRDEVAKELHVNEPTFWKIKNIIRKSDFKECDILMDYEYLKPEIGWKDKFFNFCTQAYPISRNGFLKQIFANSFFVTLIK